MKILIANKFFFRNGGSETVMFQEREFLSGHGHEVVDFSMRDERNLSSAYEKYFVDNRSYNADSGKLAKAAAALSFVHSPAAVGNIGRLIEDTRPDLLHCHNIYHQLTPSIIGAAKKLKVPVVLTLHDYKPVCPAYTRLRDGKPCSDCLSGSFAPALRNRCADGSLGKSFLLYAEAVVQRLLGSYEAVDTFIAPSRFMKDAIAHRIPAERIKVLYNGIDTDKTHGSDADDGYVLYLGRLVREKGVETLLQAHASSTGGWRLIVAGTGPLAGDLQSKYGSPEFVGHIAGDELRNMIDRAAVVVVPSEWYENCPMSVLEAMAHGKPVVASRMGGIPELVAHGKSGLLFEAGNAAELTALLDALMNAPESRAQMGREARKRAVAEFSLSRHNTGLLEIYQSVLGVRT